MGADVDLTLVAAVLGGAATMAGSLVYVGRKVERVDQRLARLEAELAEAKAARLAERVVALETQVADIRARI